MKLAALVLLLQLTGPSGQMILLDANKVATLREPRGDPKNIADGIHCLVFTVDGKNVNVIETCEQIRNMLEHRRKK